MLIPCTFYGRERYILDKKIVISLILLTLIAFAISLITVDSNGYGSVFHSLSIGFVVSAIFYFLVVYLPEYKRKNIIHESFKNQYIQFKMSCINTFLIISDSQEHSNNEQLLNLSEFRCYFKNENKHGENRWGAVAKSLEENQYYLKEIIYHLQILNEEIRYIRNTISLNDPEVFDFLNRLSQIIVRMESIEREYDVKSLCRFLWSIFTGWDWAKGYSESDTIKDIIGRIK